MTEQREAGSINKLILKSQKKAIGLRRAKRQCAVLAKRQISTNISERSLVSVRRWLTTIAELTTRTLECMTGGMLTAGEGRENDKRVARLRIEQDCRTHPPTSKSPRRA